MSLTFVHTSDWHLGRAYQRLGRKTSALRQWRFDAIHRVYDLADSQRAAFILVAGDVFQSDTPRADVMAEVLALLADAPVPTIIIPGNHDPLTEGSVWRRDEFAGQLAGRSNIRLALTCEPLELDFCDTTVFPCPVTSNSTPEDLSSWIPAGTRGGSRYRIGLAHGRWQGYSGEPYAVNFIAANRAEAAGLDYLALGDFHSYTLADHPAAKARCYYAGTSECTACDEPRAGYALLVQLDAPGDEPRVAPHRVGKMRPMVIAETLSPEAGYGPLQQKIDGLEDADDVLLKLEVSGALNESDFQDFTAWAAGLDQRLLGVDGQLGALYREPSRADFDTLGLGKAEREVLEALQQPPQASSATEGDDAQVLIAGLASRPEICREALALYYRELKQESQA
ncbi:MAG TPA: metallophosphoesterase [Pirellulales bacterium]|nr:metallophosphoesterase [Pirellulales bacterium]